MLTSISIEIKYDVIQITGLEVLCKLSIDIIANHISLLKTYTDQLFVQSKSQLLTHDETIYLNIRPIA